MRSEILPPPRRTLHGIFREATDRAARGAILDAVRSDGNAALTPAIIKSCNLSETTGRKLLQRLAEEGALHVRTSGKRRIYSIPGEEAASDH